MTPVPPPTVEEVQAKLSELTGTVVTAQQAEFFLKVYGGPEGAKLSTEDFISALTTDGVLVQTPTEAGVSYTFDYSAIDGAKAAAAIYDAGWTGTGPEGQLTHAELVQGLNTLTGSTEASGVLAWNIIEAAGTDGVITTAQLATFLDTGAVGFDAVEGGAVAITADGLDAPGSTFDYAGRTIDASHNPLTGTTDFTPEELAVLKDFDWQAFQATILPGDDALDVAVKFQTALGADAGSVDVDALFVKVSTLNISATTSDGTVVASDGEAGVFGFLLGDGTTSTSRGALNATERADALDDFFSFLATGTAPVQESISYTAEASSGGASSSLSVSAPTESDAAWAAADQLVPDLWTQTGRPTTQNADVDLVNNGDGTYTVTLRVSSGYHADRGGVASTTFSLDPVPATVAPSLSLSDASDEEIVDAVFLALGKDPATDTLTGAEFEEGLKLVTGHEPFESPEQAAYLAQLRGTDDGTGNFTLTRDEAVSVFTSGAVTRVPSDPADSASPLQFQVNYDHTVPVHHHESWWDTTLKHVEGGVKEFVSTIAGITGKSEELVANILNGKITITEVLEQGGETFLKDIATFVKTGTEEALAFVDKLGNSIKTGIKDLSEEGKAYLDTIIADAKAGASDVAIHVLASLIGLPPEELEAGLESAGAKLAATDNLANLTLEELKAGIPNFDELYAQGLAEQRELYDAFAQSAEGKAVLAENGFTVTADGRVLNATTGTAITAQEEQKFYSKYIRVDIAIELNGVSSSPLTAAFDGLQGRIFLTLPRVDENGTEFVELRFRELDEAGVAVGGSENGVDGGIVAVRDIVVPFVWSGPNEGDKGDVRYQSSLGVIGEGNFSVNGVIGGLSTLFPELGKFVADTTAEVPSIPAYLSTKSDFEVGAGLGFTVTHNLTQMAPGNRWLPFAAEFAFGGIVGALAIAGLGAVEVGSEGTATALEGLYGPTIVHGAADVGAFGGDLLLAGLFDTSEVSFGGFAWAAYRLGSPKVGEEVTGQLRFRFQANIGNDLWKGW